jgi:hypothetical protein
MDSQTIACHRVIGRATTVDSGSTVRRGSRSVSELKPPDVVLLEDGVPRAFTGFEAPPDHPSLELVVMFDVTDVERGGFWSAKTLHVMVSYWNETMARALLAEPGATIRISVYQFDTLRLRRLCRSILSPQVQTVNGFNWASVPRDRS